MNPMYFDLGEAFDTVSHEVVILNHTGVKQAWKKNTGYIYYVKRRTTRYNIRSVFITIVKIIHSYNQIYT